MSSKVPDAELMARLERDLERAARAVSIQNEVVSRLRGDVCALQDTVEELEAAVRELRATARERS